jgi:3-deoxy-D-manno-octulosonate 8-phosphate phosphatase (KDO 8-P phosphatase)
MPSSSDIRILITDVDGVLTDGRIIYSGDARGVREIKEFNVRDGLAVKLAQKGGIVVAVLTSRSSAVLERRCRELGITELHQGASSKLEATHAILSRLGFGADQLCYAGDDLPDLAPMMAAAISAAPADAAPEVLAAATWKLETAGGRGVLRELIERLLRERGAWDAIIREFQSGRPEAQSI